MAFQFVKTETAEFIISDDPFFVSDYYFNALEDIIEHVKNIAHLNYICSKYKSIPNSVFKVVAGIGNLPMIDKESLSKEDSIRLHAIIDVEVLATAHCKEQDRLGEPHDFNSFIAGFNMRREVTKEFFTAQQVKEAMLYASSYFSTEKAINKYLDTMVLTSRYKKLEIEVEMGRYQSNDDVVESIPPCMSEPKIVNNTIKITKVI